MKASLSQLQELLWALPELIGYETDTSCGDPECCGGPWYTREQFEAAVELLKEFGIEYAED